MFVSLNCCPVMLQAVEPVVQGQQPPAEERAHGSISMKTYYRYLTTQRGHLLTLLVIVVFIAGEVSGVIVVCVFLKFYNRYL